MYWQDDEGQRFREANDFTLETAQRHGMRALVLRGGDFRAGLARLKREHGIAAVLMGTRSTDPQGASLEHFTPTSTGWPA